MNIFWCGVWFFRLAQLPSIIAALTTATVSCTFKWLVKQTEEGTNQDSIREDFGKTFEESAKLVASTELQLWPAFDEKNFHVLHSRRSEKCFRSCEHENFNLWRTNRLIITLWARSIENFVRMASQVSSSQSFFDSEGLLRKTSPRLHSALRFKFKENTENYLISLSFKPPRKCSSGALALGRKRNSNAREKIYKYGNGPDESDSWKCKVRSGGNRTWIDRESRNWDRNKKKTRNDLAEKLFGGFDGDWVWVLHTWASRLCWL